tara:strand:- start:2509 stop:3126 length:618 start_codon:yes stop_codon:yes gene_type:complete
MIQIPREILELHRLASDDSTRQALNSIYFDINRAVVTNGHHLTALEHGIPVLDTVLFEKIPPDRSWPDAKTTSMLIPKGIAESILKGATKHCLFSLEVFPLQGEIEISRYDTKSDQRLKLRFDIDYTGYPDIDQVIKQKSDYDDLESTGLCGLSLKYLSDFFKYLKAVKAPWGGMFRQKSDLDPVRIDVDTGFGALTFVLMPIRI